MADFQVPTKEIVTPNGNHKVVIKQFITGFDDEAIEAIYTNGITELPTPVETEEGEAAAPAPAIKFDGKIIQAVERETVKRTVVSVDGDSSDVITSVYSMHKEDAKFVKNAVNEVVNPKEDTPKKK